MNFAFVNRSTEHVRVIVRLDELRRSLRADDSLELHGVELGVERHDGPGCRAGRRGARQQVDEVGIELLVRGQRVEDDVADAANIISLEEMESFSEDHEFLLAVEESRSTTR